MSADSTTRAPLIGIAARSVSMPGLESAFQGVAESYIEAVIAHGGIPVLIPLDLPAPSLAQLLRTLHGVFLIGGEDVQPELYGESPHPTLGTTSPRRDILDIEIARFAEKHALPILGICRGLQVLNVALGGSLFQDIPSQLPGSENHSRANFHELAHQLTLLPTSRLAAILGTDKISANSRHHQSVKVLAPCLQAVATSSDNVIEGVEHPNHPFCLAVQSHPEVVWESTEPRWKRLFVAFLQAARTRAG